MLLRLLLLTQSFRSAPVNSAGPVQTAPAPLPSAPAQRALCLPTGDPGTRSKLCPNTHSVNNHARHNYHLPVHSTHRDKTQTPILSGCTCVCTSTHTFKCAYPHNTLARHSYAHTCTLTQTINYSHRVEQEKQLTLHRKMHTQSIRPSWQRGVSQTC